MARGEKFNDIDLFIEDDATNYKKLIELKIFLENNLNAKIDIMIKKYADPIILYRALKEMKYATRH